MKFVSRVLVPILVPLAFALPAKASDLAENLPELANKSNVSAPVDFGASFLRGTNVFSRGGNHFIGDVYGAEGEVNAGLVGKISQVLAGSLTGQVHGRMTQSDYTHTLGLPEARNEEYYGRVSAGVGNRGLTLVHVSGILQSEETRTEYFDVRKFDFVRVGMEGIFSMKEKGKPSGWMQVSGGALAKIAETGSGGFVNGKLGIRFKDWVGFNLFGDYSRWASEEYGETPDYNRFQKTEAGANVIFYISLPLDHGTDFAILELKPGISYISTITRLMPKDGIHPKNLGFHNARVSNQFPSFNSIDPERNHRTMATLGAYLSF